jgi:hypothetical protein
MPNKKGSRVAASQARAKAAAKKKARSSGPDLSAIASRPAPVDTAESTEDVAPEAVAESDVELNTAEESVPVTSAAAATAPAVRRTRAASRRERQAMTVVAAGSLKWELTLIGSATAAMGVGLVVLKLATDIGR